MPSTTAEIFRFAPGLVTQLDSGSTFNFTNSWFALGRINAGTQNFYGARFQTPGNALVIRYTSSSQRNSRIEWISTDQISNLEFRVGSGFGSAMMPGGNTLVASMTKKGNTFFGEVQPNADNIKVFITNEAVGLDDSFCTKSIAVGNGNAVIGVWGILVFVRLLRPRQTGRLAQ